MRSGDRRRPTRPPTTGRVSVLERPAASSPRKEGRENARGQAPKTRTGPQRRTAGRTGRRPHPRPGGSAAREGLVAWLGSLALAAAWMAGLLVERGWPLARRGVAAGVRIGRRGARRAWTRSRAGAGAAGRVTRDHLAPRLRSAGLAALALAVLALGHAATLATRAADAGGRGFDRVRDAFAALLALGVVVWLPAGWRRARRRLPALARGAGFAALTASVLGLLSLPALHVAALAVDLDPQHGGLPTLADRSVVLAADGSTLAILHGEEDRRVVPLERIPLHVQQAVLAAEDRRFAEHPGYDLRAMGRALAANVSAGEVEQGGSTITQQLAKQNYVGSERTLGRKLRELVYAVALERQHGKDELLEHYLNQVYFGSGAYGIAAGAWEYFRAAPEELTADQAALLAALIRSPSGFAPRAHPEAMAARRDRVLDAMLHTGALTAAGHREAAARPVELAPPRGRGVREPYVVEAVRREFLANPVFGAERDERERLLLTGGLEIRTTLDPALQEHVAEVVRDHVSEGGPAAAIAVVEAGTGRVRALHGGRDFTTQQFDLATQARRQPGSAFKPFVAGAALERGLGGLDQLPAPAQRTFDIGGSSWSVRNFGGADHGTLDLHAALVHSANTPFAALAVELGTEPVVDALRRAGFDPDRALGPESARGPAIALGGVAGGVSALEMAAAYSVFAAEGRYAAPHLITEVTASGEPVHVTEVAAAQAFDPAVAAAVADMLVDAVDSGTGTAAALPGGRAAGKTGTTQDGADAWFAGFADGHAAAVWMGHPEGRVPMQDATGGRLAAPLWRDVMLGLGVR